MSLLMEALRKAEDAKRKITQEEQIRAESGGAVPAADNKTFKSPTFTLEVRESDKPSVPAQPPQPEDIADLDEEDQEANLVSASELQERFTKQGNPGRSAQAFAAARAARQQQAASSVFSAKQKAPANTRTLKIVLASLAVLLVGGGAGFWYLLGNTGSTLGVNPQVAASFNQNPRPFLDETPAAQTAAASQPGAAAGNEATTNTTAAVPAPDAPEAVAAGSSIPVAPVAVTTAESNVDETVATTATAPAAANTSPAVAVPPAVPVANPANQSAGNTPVANPALTLPSANPAGKLQISRSTADKATTDTRLQTAYKRLQAGASADAETLYREVLAERPNNRDALMGLAQIMLRRNDTAGARDAYAQILRLNPRDPLALTGLLQAIGTTDTAAYENELKLLLAQYPDVAPMQFALGNFYATQQRWGEAQAAYFNALLSARRDTGTPVSPDYAFNLAVSLERLNQKPAALEYYRQAQTLTDNASPGFDPALLHSRLSRLEQELQ